MIGALRRACLSSLVSAGQLTIRMVENPDVISAQDIRLTAEVETQVPASRRWCGYETLISSLVYRNLLV